MIKSFLLLLIVSVVVSCKSGNSGGFQHSKADTIKTLAPYIDFSKKQIISDAVIFIAKDSFGFKLVDSNNIKRSWFRDSSFYVPIIITDTSRKDEKGNPRKELRYMPTIREAVSIKFNLDTNIAILNRFMKANPQIFPPDSTKKNNSWTKK